MNAKDFSSNHYSRLLIVFACLTVALVFVRCDKWIKPENETQISSHGDDESIDDDHMFNGQNCMNCHYTEGRGEGWFTLAGTTTDNNSTGLVRLYDGVNPGTVATIEVDAAGNFYTTETIDFTTGLYVSITNDAGVEKFMSAKIYTGQCNLCHGVTTSNLSY